MVAELDRNQLGIFGIGFELGLGAVALAWIYLAGLEVTFQFSMSDTLWGVSSGVALAIVGVYFFNKPLPDEGWAASIKEFRDEITIPLALNLPTWSIVPIALASGFSEELLFRGAIHSQINSCFNLVGAVVISSLLFSLLHLPLHVRRYFPVFIIYLLVGVLFSFIILLRDENLLPAAIAHALYNGMVLTWIKLQRAGLLTGQPTQHKRSCLSSLNQEDEV